MNQYHHFVKTSLGEIVIVGDKHAITGLYTPQHKDYARVIAGSHHECLPPMQRISTQLQHYMAGEQVAWDVALPHGTPFQQNVWRALQTIPYGTTMTYSDIATQIGNPKAVRAVGSAIGKNPLLILIPCHRVVARNGALAGFAGGLEAKQWLLSHEKAHSEPVFTDFQNACNA